MITATQIEKVYKHIKGDIFQTPLVFSPELSKISQASVFLKMEHLQVSGSFKIRGVLSKISSLNKEDFDKPFVAASTGNHAAAFAYASKKFNFKAILFLPEQTSKTKIKAIEHYDIEKSFYGKSCMQTEAKATTHAKEIDGVLIHPYNDLHIIKGQGTIGLEIKKQLSKIHAVLAPIGGGGLIAGLASYFKNTATKVIGCQPTQAAEMYHSIQQNRIVAPSTLQTISDATSGGIEDQAISFDICKEALSGFELIEETAIRKAVAFMVKYHQTIVEPAAALPVAALLNTQKYKGKKIVLVLTGKKIDNNLLSKIMVDHGNDY